MQSSDSGEMSDLDNGVRRPRRTHSSDDIIDGAEPDSPSDEGDDVTEGAGAGDSPRLLVTPRKTRPGLKSYKSLSASLALSPDQVRIMIL